MKVTLTAILLFLFSINIFAQNTSIEGVVYDKSANMPLEFASVSLYQTADKSLVNGLIADINGKFKFEKLKAGDYFLKIQFVGYESLQTANVKLSTGEKLNIGKQQLLLNQRFLNEVKVSGQALQNVNKIDKQVYKADQFVAAKGGTAVDVIKNMPSVAVDGQGEISVRGSKGFLVLINGKPVQTDANTILSQLPANMVENIELITAPSAKYDADGKGGIINITTKKGADDGLAFIVNLQGGLPSVEDYGNKEKQQRYGADVTLNYKKEKWDLSASANYLRNDNAGYRDGDVFTIIGNKKTTFPSVGERSFDKHNYGGRFNLGFTPSKNNQFSVGFFAGHKFQDRLADINYNNTNTQVSTGNVIGRTTYFNSNLQNKQGDFLLGNFDYTHTFQNNSSLSFSAVYEHANLYGSTKNRNIEAQDTVQNTLSTYKNPLDGFRTKLDYAINIGKGKLETGYQYRLDKQDGLFIYGVKNLGEADFTTLPTFSGDVKATNQIHSLYSQYSGKANRLEYVGGLRYEYATRDLKVSSGTTDDYKLELNNLFPSVNVLYSLTNGWKLKAGISRRVQRTNNFELNPIPEREHSETLEQGDAQLLPEFIYLAEAGLTKTFEKGSLISTIYYQDIKNPIQRVNSVFADTVLNRVFTNANKGKRLGLEIGANYSPVKWNQLYIGTNIYKSTLNGVILNYPNNIENSAWVYSINANTNFQVTPTFSIQGNVNYLSKRPTVQGEDGAFLSPNTSVKKTFMNGRLTALVQWQNMDLGLLKTNEQRITTSGPDFFTTTNYIYEVDVLMLNLSFNLNKLTKKLKLPNSEFGEKEF
jgi:outer membrane receptor protein involved in Fe transport